MIVGFGVRVVDKESTCRYEPQKGNMGKEMQEIVISIIMRLLGIRRR